MPLVDFISQTYESISKNVSSKRTLNLYPESTEGEGKSNLILVGCAGTTETADFEYVEGTETTTITTPAVTANSFIGNGVDSGVELSTLTSVPDFFAWTSLVIYGGSGPIVAIGGAVSPSQGAYFQVDVSGGFIRVYSHNTSYQKVFIGDTPLVVGVAYSIYVGFTVSAGFVVHVNNVAENITEIGDYDELPSYTLPFLHSLGSYNNANTTKGNHTLYETYWSTSALAIDRDSTIVNATGQEHFTQVAPDALPSAWLGGAVQGTVIITPEQTQTITTQNTGISGVSPTSGCRGMHYASNNILYVVYGGALIKYLPNGLSVKILSLSENSGTRVSMADNGTDLVLVDGAFLKTVRLSDDIVGTPTVDFVNPTEVVFLGRRLVVINESNKFWWSDIDDASTWDALSVASAETNPDNILAIAVKDGELWLMGERSYEVRRVDSDPNNPYSLVGGSANQVGVGAKYSLTSIADNVFWLGSSVAGQNQVFMSNGYSEQRISNHALEWELDKYKANTSSAFGVSYQQEGHTFYYLTIPQADKTFGFDLATGMWHERSTRDALKNIFHQWAVTHCAFAYGRILCGNGEVPKLLELSLDKYDEWDGRPIVKLHQSPVYFTDYKQLYHNIFEVDIETGVGLQTGQGSKPEIMMQYSDDGGHTWSSERWTSLGNIGKYRTRAIWRRLGRSRERVYRVLVSDPVKVVMIGAKLDYSVGANK